jgi:hypothetical protein
MHFGCGTSFSFPSSLNRCRLFWSQISSFLGDYSNALIRAQAFDNQVASDANKISADYASIVALSIRQAIGAIEITLSKNSNGSFNTSDVIVFMKGNSIFVSFLNTF